jgi:RNA polymerase sigma factor (sigma-70 family)
MYSDVEPLPKDEQQALAMEVYEYYDDVKRIVIQLNTCFDVVYHFLDGLTDEQKFVALFGDGTPNPDNLTKKERLDHLMEKLKNCLDDKVHWSDVWVLLTDLHVSPALREACTHNLLEQASQITEIDRSVNVLIKTKCPEKEQPLIKKALRKNRAAGRWVSLISDEKIQTEAKRLLKKYSIIRAKNVKDCEALLEKSSQVEKMLSKATEIGQKLCVTNVKLAMKQSAKKHPNPDDFHDYVHEGMLGMFRASELYNPYSKAAFTTYSYYHLCDAVNRYHNEISSLINHPMKLKKELADMNHHVDEHRYSDNDSSQIEHLKTSLGKTEGEIKELMSYDTQVFTDDFDALENSEDDYNALPDELYERDFNQKKVRQMYQKLSKTEQVIFDCRMTGKLKEHISLRQFQEKTNIPYSGEHVRKLQKKVEKKMIRGIKGE